MTTIIQRPKGAYSPASGQLPVGFVFISVVSTNPATLLGYGTWLAFGTGMTLVGLDSGDPDFDTVEETTGAKTKAISTHAGTAVTDHSAHTHTGPSHQHNLSGGAATTHSHTYTEVVNHVHVQNAPTSASGGAELYALDTNASGSTSSGLSTANPTGSVGATGTTAANTAGVTDNAGTGATGNPSATLTHSVTQPSAHSDLNVVQPSVVVYMFKRTA